MKEGLFYWAGWHPDGRISVIGRHRTLGGGFFTVSPAGGEPVKSEPAPTLVPIINSLNAYQFTWMPDGRHVIFEAAQAAGLMNLWRIAVEGDKLTWSAAARLTTGATLDVGAARSPDGKRLAYTVATQAVGLYAYGLPRHGSLSGRATPLNSPDQTVLTSDVSRDGRRVAYEAVQTGTQGASRLWAHDLVSGVRESLSPDDAYRRAPVWSPDGSMLAYHYVSTARGSVLAVRDAGGRERFISRRRQDGYVIPTHWSPDGRFVLASDRKSGGLVSIGLWPIDRTDQAEPQRTLLSDPSMNLWQGHFSPDGRWLSFVYIDREGRVSGIAVAPSEGADPSRWIRVPGEMVLDKPRWAHDGPQPVLPRPARALVLPPLSTRVRPGVWPIRRRAGAAQRLQPPRPGDQPGGGDRRNVGHRDTGLPHHAQHERFDLDARQHRQIDGLVTRSRKVGENAVTGGPEARRHQQ